MANEKAYNIHIRLNRNDYDLLLLASQCKMPDIVKGAIRNYISGQREAIIPMPSYLPMSQSYKAVNVRLDGKKDKDIIDFVEAIPKGNKNAIYKILIRHAMEMPDIRQWLNDPDAAKRPKAESKVQKKASQANPGNAEKTASPLVKKPEIRPTPPKPASVSADEDDIFRLI